MSSQEQPEDQQADDQPEEAEEQDAGDSAPEAAADTAPTEDERIEQITERIDKARTKAEDAGVLQDTDEAEFADSGATEKEDDQTIAPPG